jgi:hypothetical protein
MAAMGVKIQNGRQNITISYNVFHPYFKPFEAIVMSIDMFIDVKSLKKSFLKIQNGRHRGQN